jgi:hypothetical protein
MKFCSVNMDAWYYRTSVACDSMEWYKVQHFNVVVWSTPLGLPEAMWHMHAPTINKWQQHKKKKKKKKKTLHMLTCGTMWGCGLTSLVVCINDKFCDKKERNVTIRSEICTTNICSLGYQDIREWVTLWRLILHSLGRIIVCEWTYHPSKIITTPKGLLPIYLTWYWVD